MTRSARAWWLALAGSLLLHVGLLGGLRWRLPQREVAAEPPVFDAQLSPAAAPAVTATPPTRTPPAARPPASRLPARPPAGPIPEPPVELAAGASESGADGGLADTTPALVEEISVAPAASAEAAPPPLNPLPSRLDLHFQVRYGLASGKQTLLWVNEGERYTLTSVAAATGLTGVFYSGQFVQTSRGRITPRGLQPEEFWDQRGNKRSSARFDTANGTLTLTPANGEPRHFAYQGDVQDALSLLFQLALTAPPPDGPLSFAVFNGKKLRHYSYEVRGEEILETALGALRTLHLARATDGDGRFEIWLAVDRHYLPVRVLRGDDTGKEVELKVQSIAP